MTSFTPTSLLAEALHASLERLSLLLQREFDQSAQPTAIKLTESLGFKSWPDLCDRVSSTTSRDVDSRLEPLIERHLDDDLANRLAVGFGSTPAKMQQVLRELRDPNGALAEQACCSP